MLAELLVASQAEPHRMSDITHLSKFCTPSYSNANSYLASLANSSASRLDYRSDLDRDVILESHAKFAFRRIRRRRADNDTFVDDTATADGYPAMRGVELVSGVDDGLAADIDGVVSGQDSIVVDDYGGRNIDGCFGELPCPGHHRMPFSRRRHGGGCLSRRWEAVKVVCIVIQQHLVE